MEDTDLKTLKFEIVVKSSTTEIARVAGIREVGADVITVGDIEDIPKVEAFLERLTGLRFHINQVN